MIAIKQNVKELLDRKSDFEACILYSYACVLGEQFKLSFEHMYNKLHGNISELEEYMTELMSLGYLSNDGKYRILNPPYLENTSQLELEVTERIQEYRDLFNIKQGWMGDKQACIKKLTKWLQSDKSSTFEDVIEAATYYISITDSKYTMRADYFIEKNSTSTLSAFIEDAKNGNIEDWTKTIL